MSVASLVLLMPMIASPSLLVLNGPVRFFSNLHSSFSALCRGEMALPLLPLASPPSPPPPLGDRGEMELPPPPDRGERRPSPFLAAFSSSCRSFLYFCSCFSGLR